MAQIHHPFDKLFKVAFTDIKCIKALITTYFDAVITEALLLDTLKIVPNEHLNADFVKKCPVLLPSST